MYVEMNSLFTRIRKMMSFTREEKEYIALRTLWELRPGLAVLVPASHPLVFVNDCTEWEIHVGRGCGQLVLRNSSQDQLGPKTKLFPDNSVPKLIHTWTIRSRNSTQSAFANNILEEYVANMPLPALGCFGSGVSNHEVCS
ncbi:hypothetical protein C0J52_26457 [Blattella germanica]|nr:hypothetical protein C0J52_26457 [Blattella germanica]